MALPFFYVEQAPDNTGSFILAEDTSKHIVQVLRMANGEQLQLTDGKGKLFTCEITDNNRKKCVVKTIKVQQKERSERQVTIAISLVKNNSRFEWFLEKATEIGIAEIIPLICERTEKQVFKQERMKSILTSAMLQSQQVWLPALTEPKKLKPFVADASFNNKYIAHCEDQESKVQLTTQRNNTGTRLILIGPEGDFSNSEIKAAIEHDFTPVALGNTRLRTETAGLVAASLLVQ